MADAFRGFAPEVFEWFAGLVVCALLALVLCLPMAASAADAPGSIPPPALPDVTVLMLSVGDKEQAIEAGLAGGASEYLVKGGPAGGIVDAIKRYGPVPGPA